MLTEENFTEDIEVENKLVDSSTTNSIFFDGYYQSLQAMESGNHQLLDAQAQLQWYTSKLHEVDKLANEVGIPNSFTLSAADLRQVSRLDCDNYEQYFKSFHKSIAELKNARSQGIDKIKYAKFQQTERMNEFQVSSQKYIDELEAQLFNISKSIKALNEKTTREKYELKMEIASSKDMLIKVSIAITALILTFLILHSSTLLMAVALILILVFLAFTMSERISNSENIDMYHVKIRGLNDELSKLNSKKEELSCFIPAEKERIEKQTQSFKKENLNKIKNIEQENLNKTSSIRDNLNSSISMITAYQRLAHHLATIEAPRELNEVVDEKYHTLATIFNKTDDLDRTPPRLVTLPWHDRMWTPVETDGNSYAPQTDGLAPEMLRIGNLLRTGTLSLDRLDRKAEIPAFVPIRCLSPQMSAKMPGHIVIFSNDANSRQAAISVIESIALRLISTFPIRKLQGIFIDPVSMGNSFPFKSLPKQIVGQQTYTRTDDIREQLCKLTVHTEQIIQNYLSRYYQSIEEYNAVKSAVEEAYRYLFVADFPTNFDSTSWEDLKSLLINGSKAGVYGIIHIDETLERPRNFNYDIFTDSCTVIRPLRKYDRGRTLFSMTMPNGLECEISLDAPPPNEQFNQITAAITAAAKTIKTDTVPFSDMYPSEFWAGDSRREIRAPIGVTGARDKIEFWMGNNEDGLVVSSGLLAGKPGAGKSFTLHATISSLAMKYSPDELELYLLDFKEGVEFQLYIDPEQSERSSQEPNEHRSLPHAKVISIESDREFGLSVLQQVQKQIEERAHKFKTPGINVENLNQYRDKTGEKMPRILVVIDEFQYMFQERGSITDKLNLIFEDIMRRGRAFGIHLLLASQSPNVPNMSNTLYSYIDLRMAMQMDRNTAASVLAEGNTDAVDLLDRPGKLIYNSDLGRKGSNNVGQVADISQKERIKAVLQTLVIAGEKNFERSTPLIMFNGTRPSKLAYNGQLAKLSLMDDWLSSVALNKQIIQNEDWFPQEFPGVVWLGESMKIGNHTQAIFRRRQRSNLLIVGGAEESVFGTIGGILLSLVHCYQPDHAHFQIVDLSQSLDEENEGWTTMSLSFRDCFSKYFPIEVGKRFPDPDRQVPKAEYTLRKAFDELELRLAKQKENPDELNLGNPYFLVCAIGSLNRAQYLRPVAGKRGEEMSEDAQKLMNLITQGPELGIHTILWADNMATFRQLSGDSRSALSPFDLRVGLAMPENDSRDLLGEGYAKNLPRLRAYYRDMSVADGLEKFKPYAVPSIDDIQKYNQRFEQRLLGRNNRG
jgi:DNA segregation ATPase FtsK/SpoIIIE, S-DNA-T family